MWIYSHSNNTSFEEKEVIRGLSTINWGKRGDFTNLGSIANLNLIVFWYRNVYKG